MPEVLERGDILFFYRPTVQPAELAVGPPAAAEHDGVQSFFVVLAPAGGKHRRLRIGRKRMPSPSGERFWGRIERVGTLERVLADQLEAEHYVTKTRGERYQPGARPIAQGCYAFVRHDDHVHLAYRLEHTEPDVPEALRVPDAGSHVVLFERTPRTKATWTTVGEPAQLDTEGEELVLVGVDDEPERELGIELLVA
ncbi:MAG TPA: hypothetical protein VFQ53_32955 [Kofleriaceae bacterium]|nr:hypothetical protein [Kofleriaceae bacterium]